MATIEKLFDLAGRRALITGATRGIGIAVAQAFLAHGAAVAITGRKPDTLHSAVEQLRTDGADVRGHVCNQGDSDAIQRLFDQLDAESYPADVVVINAATNPVMGPLLETDLDAWRKILDVNLTGAFLTARAAIRRMVPLTRGSVIFVASIAGVEPMSGLGAYSVSKSGLLGLMRTLAKELGPSGIRVNALAPGLVETRFAAALFQDKSGYESLMARTPLRRHGQPLDIAGAAVFLASEASAYVTGQTLVIDGGGRV
jgi:NAD(P)-dependent dehydrogenase (short-subunit alcohol dehydrogenase family)